MAGKFALVLKSLHFMVQFDYNGLKKTLNNGAFPQSFCLSHAEQGQTESYLRSSFFVCFTVKKPDQIFSGIDQHSSPVAGGGAQQVTEKRVGEKLALGFKV